MGAAIRDRAGGLERVTGTKCGGEMLTISASSASAALAVLIV
jgi:hypothetical protein